jgi:hypothetical protein
MISNQSRINSSRDIILKKEEYKDLSQNSRVSIASNNPLKKPQGCRLCNFNKPCMESDISTLKNFNLNHPFYKVDILNPAEEGLKLIYPCDCLLPVHFKCINNYIGKTQNLKCPLCSVYLIFKPRKQLTCIKKAFSNENFWISMLYMMIQLITFVSGFFILEADLKPKYVHLKYISSVLLYIICVIFSISYFLFIKKLKNYPLSDEILLREKKTSLGENIERSRSFIFNRKNDFQNVLDEMSSGTSLINLTKKEAANSMSIYLNFLKHKFKISDLDVVMFKKEFTRRRDIKNNYNSRVFENIREITNNNFNYSGKSISEGQFSYYVDFMKISSRTNNQYVNNNKNKEGLTTTKKKQNKKILTAHEEKDRIRCSSLDSSNPNSERTVNTATFQKRFGTNKGDSSEDDDVTRPGKKSTKRFLTLKKDSKNKSVFLEKIEEKEVPYCPSFGQVDSGHSVSYANILEKESNKEEIKFNNQLDDIQIESYSRTSKKASKKEIMKEQIIEYVREKTTSDFTNKIYLSPKKSEKNVKSLFQSTRKVSTFAKGLKKTPPSSSKNLRKSFTTARSRSTNNVNKVENIKNLSNNDVQNAIIAPNARKIKIQNLVINANPNLQSSDISQQSGFDIEKLILMNNRSVY